MSDNRMRLTVSVTIPTQWGSTEHPVGEALQALFSAVNEAYWHRNQEEEQAGRPRQYHAWDETWTYNEED